MTQDELQASSTTISSRGHCAPSGWQIFRLTRVMPFVHLCVHFCSPIRYKCWPLLGIYVRVSNCVQTLGFGGLCNSVGITAGGILCLQTAGSWQLIDWLSKCSASCDRWAIEITQIFSFTSCLITDVFYTLKIRLCDKRSTAELERDLRVTQWLGLEGPCPWDSHSTPIYRLMLSSMFN